MMNQTEYSQHCVCSRQRVSQWIEAGMPASIQGFIDPISADLWREQNLEQAKRPNSPNANARLRKLQAEAEIAEMKARKLSGVLKPVAEMESLIASLAIAHRDFLFSFIARLAPLISGKIWEQAEVFQFLQQRVRSELRGQGIATQSPQEPQDEADGDRDSQEGKEAVTEPPPHDPSWAYSTPEWKAFCEANGI